MHGTYLKQRQPLCVICTVCEQPALVCHGPQLPCMCQLQSSLLLVAFKLIMRSGSSLRAEHETFVSFVKCLNVVIYKIYGIWPQASKQAELSWSTFQNSNPIVYAHVCQINPNQPNNP